MEPPPHPPLVEELRATFRRQAERALEARLDDSRVSLAFADHYLAMARDEDRPPILALLAAGAGVHFGDVVCRELGGFWLAADANPRSLRILLRPGFVYFSPVDIALQAIVGETLAATDARLPRGVPFDPSFHLHPDPPAPALGKESHASWIATRLAERVPLPEHQFHSLTGRFETLELILELLATREHGAGLQPRTYVLADYIAVLAKGGEDEEDEEDE